MKDNLFDLTTTWNQAEALQYRIHDICQRISEARRQGHIKVLYIELLNLFAEVSSQMTDEEQKGLMTKLEMAGATINSRIPYNKNKAVGPLFDSELEIRRIMRDRGMLLPTREDPGSAMRGRSF